MRLKIKIFYFSYCYTIQSYLQLILNRNNIVKALVITLRKLIAKDIFSTLPKARNEKILPNNR